MFYKIVNNIFSPHQFPGEYSPGKRRIILNQNIFELNLAAFRPITASPPNDHEYPRQSA